MQALFIPECTFTSENSKMCILRRFLLKAGRDQNEPIKIRGIT